MLTNVIGTISEIKEEQFFTTARGDKINRFFIILETHKDTMGNSDYLSILFVNHYYAKFKVGQKICCRISVLCKNKEVEYPINAITAVDYVIDSDAGKERRNRRNNEFLKRPDYGKKKEKDGFGNVIYNSY